MIIDMGGRFVAAIKWSDTVAVFDPVSFEITVRTMMAPESGGLVLVAQNGAGLAGMAGSLIYPCFFNLQTLMAQESSTRQSQSTAGMLVRCSSRGWRSSAKASGPR